MKLIHTIRSLLGIRVNRETPRPGALPQVGSSIVKDRMRIKLKYPISSEQWHWFTEKGWRVVDMRKNQRKYTVVPDAALVALLDADKPDREAVYQTFFKKKSEVKE